MLEIKNAPCSFFLISPLPSFISPLLDSNELREVGRSKKVARESDRIHIAFASGPAELDSSNLR